MHTTVPVAHHAAKGGKARASVLTADERKAIARTAALARWAAKRAGSQASAPPPRSIEQPNRRFPAGPGMPVLPVALFRGALTIGDTQCSVYVLESGQRVIAQRDALRLLTGKATGEVPGNDSLPERAIRFSIPGAKHEGIGYEAAVLLDTCDAFLEARHDRKVDRTQEGIAVRAEMVTRACAKAGMAGLIDEATGYQAFRRKQELQLKVLAMVAEELQEWALMFPQEFWAELARLERVHYAPRSRPLRWSKYVLALVYDAIAPHIGKELGKRHSDSHLRQTDRQWLKEQGRRKVYVRIARVVANMKRCDDIDAFRKQFAAVFKKSALDPRLNLAWDTGS